MWQVLSPLHLLRQYEYCNCRDVRNISFSALGKLHFTASFKVMDISLMMPSNHIYKQMREQGCLLNCSPQWSAAMLLLLPTRNSCFLLFVPSASLVEGYTASEHGSSLLLPWLKAMNSPILLHEFVLSSVKASGPHLTLWQEMSQVNLWMKKCSCPFMFGAFCQLITLSSSIMQGRAGTFSSHFLYQVQCF